MTLPYPQRDNVWIGLGLGLLLPILSYGVLLLIYTLFDEAGVFSDVGMAEDFRTRTLGLMSICANVFLIQFRRKTFSPETVRGILIATMGLVVVWFVKYGINILQG